MKPFAHLAADRARDPERCTREAVARLTRWASLSGGKTVSLDEVAWFAAVFHLAGIKAQEMVAAGVKVEESDVTGARVVEVMATDRGAIPDVASAGG